MVSYGPYIYIYFEQATFADLFFLFLLAFNLFVAQPSEGIFASSLWQSWIYDLSIPIPKELGLTNGPRLAKALRNLGSPTHHTQTDCLRALQEAVHISGPDMTQPPAPTPPANVNVNEPAGAATSMLEKLFAVQSKPVPSLARPNGDDRADGPISGINKVVLKIRKLLQGIAYIRAWKSCYDTWHPNLANIDLDLITSTGSVPIIKPAYSQTPPSGNSMTTNQIIEGSFPSSNRMDTTGKDNPTSLRALKNRQSHMSKAAFAWGPMVGFMICGVRGLMVASSDREAFPQSAGFTLLSLAEELQGLDPIGQPFREDIWARTHDFIMRLVLSTYSGSFNCNISIQTLCQCLCFDYATFWLKRGCPVGLYPPSSELVGPLVFKHPLMQGTEQPNVGSSNLM